MKKTFYSFFAVLFISQFIIGCKGTEGPAGPSLTGSLIGTIELIQSDGSVASDESGVAVSIEGTSTSVTTDTNGKWTIPNLQTGTYTIDFNKTGYGESKVVSRQFVGGGESIVAKTYLSEAPNFTVSFDQTKTHTDSNSVQFWMSMNGNTINQGCKVLLILGNSNDVSASDPTKYLYADVINLPGDVATSSSVRVYRSDLIAAGFTSGSTAYAVVYGLNYGVGVFYSNYLDPVTGKTVYTSPSSPSSPLQIQIP